MINYKTGDVTQASQRVILHGCNAKGKFNAGVAKAIRNKWPEVYDRYSKAYDEFGLIPGSIIVVLTDDKEKLVINAITQPSYGRDPNTVYVDYDAVQLALEETKTVLDSYGLTALAMPRIGTGLGNGSWDKIKQIIEEELPGINVTVYVPEGVTD
jgi:O-acetyl-ADP-ribose deacetylase (regulator of RNase III)